MTTPNEILIKTPPSHFYHIFGESLHPGKPAKWLSELQQMLPLPFWSLIISCCNSWGPGGCSQWSWSLCVLQAPGALLCTTPSARHLCIPWNLFLVGFICSLDQEQCSPSQNGYLTMAMPFQRILLHRLRIKRWYHSQENWKPLLNQKVLYGLLNVNKNDF